LGEPFLLIFQFLWWKIKTMLSQRGFLFKIFWVFVLVLFTQASLSFFGEELIGLHFKKRLSRLSTPTSNRKAIQMDLIPLGDMTFQSESKESNPSEKPLQRGNGPALLTSFYFEGDQKTIQESESPYFSSALYILHRTFRI
jgi:hypothetical protein